MGAKVLDYGPVWFSRSMASSPGQALTIKKKVLDGETCWQYADGLSVI
jgi:hypothetical protein